MRLIYLLASDADSAAAAEVETLLKQRGYMVRRAQEALAYAPARPEEITLALWSRSVQFSAKQILFINRAIDAWTEGRLIFARLDHSLLPRGLGDVSTIDLSFAPSRMAAVWKVVEAAQEIDRAQVAKKRERGPGPGGATGAERAPSIDLDQNGPQAAPDIRTGRFSLGQAIAVGLVAAAAFGSLGFLTLPSSPNLLIAAAALAWGAVAGALAGYVRRIDRQPAPQVAAKAPPPAAAEMAEPEPDENGSAPVFVSYARRDSEVVYPLVEGIEASGREVWIDRDDIHAGENWAGLIVRAIRGSDTFCLMCTAEAFQSDNVRREIYIAEKYKRKLLPVRLDFAEMPEDFEYFLIDRQWLDLTTLAPEERAIRLKAALAR